MARSSDEKPGLAARASALRLVQGVKGEGKTLDHLLAHEPLLRNLDERDRSFAHALAATVLRHWGELAAEVQRLIPKALPRSAGPAGEIIALGLAQLHFMKTSPAAAIDLSVELAKADVKAKHFSGLINASLRRSAREEAFQPQPILNLPPWLRDNLTQSYGIATTQAIAEAHACEAPLDLSVKQDAPNWASVLGATLLPTGSLRLNEGPQAVPALAGFAEGVWWVQDTAAAMPIDLLGNVKGLQVLDLCAAPGGKTAQLANRGASVTALDSSPERISRLKENMARLKLEVETVTVDVMAYAPGRYFDVVVLDAPCSSTGTMRRHPDLALLKSPAQISALADLQQNFLEKAASFVSPEGRLLYCTCSLLPQEGEQQIEKFLETRRDFRLTPLSSVPHAPFITGGSYLRTLPSMKIGDAQGMDGFFACVLQRD